MKAITTTLLSLAVICAEFSSGAESKEVYDVSIIQLISAPKEYASKEVRVVGFLNIGFEGDAVYFHEEDFKRGLLSNGLGIRAEPGIRRRLEKLTGQYVTIEGVFDASLSDEISVSPFRLWITNITRADSWTVESHPTP